MAKKCLVLEGTLENKESISWNGPDYIELDEHDILSELTNLIGEKVKITIEQEIN